MSSRQLCRKRPVVPRGTQTPAQITDAQLLSNDADADWLHTDLRRVMRIQAEFVEDFGALAKLGPTISVFGSVRTRSEGLTYRVAMEVGAGLARADYAVITGGGPGMTEAANRGCHEVSGTSAGLGIELPREQGMNEYVDLGTSFRYFFARRIMLIKYSNGFVVMPGGIGALDGLSEALTLVQTQKISSFLIALVNSGCWNRLLEWLRTSMIKHGMISTSDPNLLHVADDAEATVDYVVSTTRRPCDGRAGAWTTS